MQISIGGVRDIIDCDHAFGAGSTATRSLARGGPDTVCGI